MPNLLTLALTALTLSPTQKFLDCRAALGLAPVTRAYAADGVLLARGHAEFSAKEIAGEAARRADAMPGDYWVLARGADPAAHYLTAFAATLAARSNLTAFLNNPEPLTIFVERTGHEKMPRATVKAGVVSINRRMLELAETDDELAEIVGHETLHHTLAHGLVLARAQASGLIKALRLGGGGDMLFGGESPTHALAAAAVERRGRAIEAEIHAAIGGLLATAGYDQWAIVTLWEKQLAAARLVGRPYFDHHGERELQSIIDAHRARLEKLEIQPRPRHSTVVVDRLRALLREIPN